MPWPTRSRTTLKPAASTWLARVADVAILLPSTAGDSGSTAAVTRAAASTTVAVPHRERRASRRTTRRRDALSHPMMSPPRGRSRRVPWTTTRSATRTASRVSRVAAEGRQRLVIGRLVGRRSLPVARPARPASPGGRGTRDHPPPRAYGGHSSRCAGGSPALSSAAGSALSRRGLAPPRLRRPRPGLDRRSRRRGVVSASARLSLSPRSGGGSLPRHPTWDQSTSVRRSGSRPRRRAHQLDVRCTPGTRAASATAPPAAGRAPVSSTRPAACRRAISIASTPRPAPRAREPLV